VEASRAPSDDTGTVLELYKTAVEMADRVSARRAGANSFFVTLNTALAAVVSIVSAARKPPPHGNLPSFDAFGLVCAAIAGIVLSFVWWALLRYYRRLSKAKWDVINRMEERLPASPFTDEWKGLHPGESSLGKEPAIDSWQLWKRLARWRQRTKHREATVVEQVVPFVFMLIYLAVGLRVIVQ
jgi:hypothetical protein